MPSGNGPNWGDGNSHRNDETRVQPAVNPAPNNAPGPNGPYGPYGPYGPPQGQRPPANGPYNQGGGYPYGPGPYGQPQPQRQPEPQPQPEPQRSSSKDAWIAGGVIILILAVVIALGVFLYQNYFSGNDDSTATTSSSQSGPATAGDSPATQSSSSSSSSAPTETSEADEARPRDPNMPDGAIAANDSARRGAPAGDFNNVYRGTEITSEPFAQSVRDAFVRYYLDTDKTSGTVEAYSTVTGKTYSMSCNDNGEFVTCRGGNDAVVYIS